MVPCPATRTLCSSFRGVCISGISIARVKSERGWVLGRNTTHTGGSALPILSLCLFFRMLSALYLPFYNRPATFDRFFLKIRPLILVPAFVKLHPPPLFYYDYDYSFLLPLLFFFLSLFIRRKYICYLSLINFSNHFIIFLHIKILNL